MPNPMTRPNWEHASSRYMCVTPEVIDLLQTNFINGISLVDAIPGIDSNTAGVIVAESLEADRIWNLPPDQLLSGFNQGPESDFKSAVLAELLFEAAEVAHKEDRHDTEQNLWSVAMASLEKIARSLTASPLLWYEDIYFELAQNAQKTPQKRRWTGSNAALCIICTLTRVVTVCRFYVTWLKPTSRKESWSAACRCSLPCSITHRRMSGPTI
jgi:hypothetical protein